MTELDAWLWLTLKEPFRYGRPTRVLELFETPMQAYCASKKTLKKTKGLHKKEIIALSDKSLEEAERVKALCRKHGIRILTFDSDYYPDNLRHIPDPPYVLYVRSRERINLNNKLCIAMVGNRLMTEYGRCTCYDIAKGFSAAGVVVVSGMARGIDGVAHTAALRSGGITVAVLGCGLDRAYPPEHEELMAAIANNGMVISEYPPGTPPLGKHFPLRNRIISGLSDGVVVVEAPEKSGALITANDALKQGRDVFAVPGDVMRGHSKGTNQLIHDGAILVTSALDVLKEYETVYINTLKEYINKEKYAYTEEQTEEQPVIAQEDSKSRGLNDTAKKIVGALSTEPVHIDALSAKLSLSSDTLSGELMLLEIQGIVKTLPGKHFILNV